METKDEGPDSDSSCELDDLPKITDITEPPSGKKKFDNGEIVWAEFHGIYWPAMIQRVFLKERKARLWYLDSPKTHYTIPFTKIKSLRDGRVSAKIREEAKLSPYHEQHEKLLIKMMSFLQRKSSGINDDPILFFEEGSAYIAAANLGLDLNSISASKEIIDAPLYAPDEVAETEDIKSDCNLNDEDYISENVIDNSNTDLDRDLYTSRLVRFILKGDANQHLLSIYSNSIPSERQNVYYTLRHQKKEKQLYFTNFTGLLKNTTHRDKITAYLIDIFKRNITDSKFNTSDICRYAVSVWMPEALTKAISVIENVTLDKAQKLCFETDDDILKKLFSKSATLASESNESGCSSKSTDINFEETTNAPSVIIGRILRKKSALTHNHNILPKKVSVRKSKRTVLQNRADISSIRKKKVNTNSLQTTKSCFRRKSTIIPLEKGARLQDANSSQFTQDSNTSVKKSVRRQKKISSTMKKKNTNSLQTKPHSPKKIIMNGLLENADIDPPKKMASRRGHAKRKKLVKLPQKVRSNLKQHKKYSNKSSGKFENEQDCDTSIANYKQDENVGTSDKSDYSNSHIEVKNCVTDNCLQQKNIETERKPEIHKSLIMRISKVENEFGIISYTSMINELGPFKVSQPKAKRKSAPLDVEVSNRILRTRIR